MSSDATTTSPSPPPPSLPTKKSFIQRVEDWGTSSLPPALLATLVTALHARPFQPLPLFIFAPTLLFSSYLNLAGLTTASAGLTAAWSGIYALVALRRTPRRLFGDKFSLRGLVRASAIGLATANSTTATWVYTHGDFRQDEEQSRARNRWL